MNFNTFKKISKQPPPVINRVVRRVPVSNPGQPTNSRQGMIPSSRSSTQPHTGSNEPTRSIPAAQATIPSKPRRDSKDPDRSTPGSINKDHLRHKSNSVPAARSFEQLYDLYQQKILDDQSQVEEAREHGISLKDIEIFDLTTLYGAHEDAMDRLHAKNDPSGSPRPLSPLRSAGDTPPYDSNGEEGDEVSPGAERADFVASPRVSDPPAAPLPAAGPPRLVVTLPVPPGFHPAAPLATPAPARRAANRPSDPPGPPINAVYAVGSVPIPLAVQLVADEINARAARKSNKQGFPQRVDLRNMPSGMSDLDRRYGYITRNSGLMGVYGDLRLFNEATWRYLVSSGKGD